MASHQILLLLVVSAIFAVTVRANIFIKDSTQRSVHQHRTNLFTKNTRDKETFQPILVEVLQQRYLLLEDALWNVIVSGLEQSYVLEQIHNGHHTFFLGNFSVHHCYLSTFDPQQSIVSDAMNSINRSATDTVASYLRASGHSYSERDALSISVRNQNLTYQLDVLFDKMLSSDFLTIIRNVSHFLWFGYKCCLKVRNCLDVGIFVYVYAWHDVCYSWSSS